MEEKKEVIAVLAIGEKWLKEFNEKFRYSFERFANKIGAELVVIDDFIRPSKKRPPWQKLLIFDHPKISKYDRAMFMDADILITRHAKNPFSEIEKGFSAICDDNPDNLESIAEVDMKLYAHCPEENRPAKMMNSGVFIVGKDSKPMLEYVYDNYEEQHCCDNGPLSYHMLNSGKNKILSPEFNTVVSWYRRANGYGLSTILKMYNESSFIHFAGGGMTKSIPAFSIIRHIDKNPNSILTKIIYFLGKEEFDFLTAPTMSFIKRIVCIYNYRVKRRFFSKS